jgi:hypothetical protein
VRGRDTPTLVQAGRSSDPPRVSWFRSAKLPRHRQSTSAYPGWRARVKSQILMSGAGLCAAPACRQGSGVFRSYPVLCDMWLIGA